jgi:hypothetical protein
MSDVQEPFEEISAYEIFLKLPDKLDYTTPLSVEEQVALQGASALVDKMTPSVKQVFDVALAACTECNWENVPTNALYSARIVIASVAPYTERMRQITRDGHADTQGSS